MAPADPVRIFTALKKLIIKVMDKVRVSLVIQSHLSDAVIEMYLPTKGQAQERLRFVKYLVHHYPNTNQEILVDFVYEQFKKFDTKQYA